MTRSRLGLVIELLASSQLGWAELYTQLYQCGTGKHLLLADLPRHTDCGTTILSCCGKVATDELLCKGSRGAERTCLDHPGIQSSPQRAYNGAVPLNIKWRVNYIQNTQKLRNNLTLLCVSPVSH